jgi:hypothetical protein
VADFCAAAWPVFTPPLTKSIILRGDYHFITMKLTGLAMNFGKSVHPPIKGCKRQSANAGGAALSLDVASTLSGSRKPTR